VPHRYERLIPIVMRATYPLPCLASVSSEREPPFRKIASVAFRVSRFGRRL
jgi:hypothetical protein